MAKFTEDTVEQAAIQWLQAVGYDYLHGGIIAPSEPRAERDNYNEVLLINRLRSALERINSHIPRSVRAGVVDEVIRASSANRGIMSLRDSIKHLYTIPSCISK